MAASGVDIQSIVSVTLQNTVLAATASLVGQVLTSYRQSQSLTVDWAPVALFMLWTFISTPPNYLWQQHLEDTYPANPTVLDKASATKPQNTQDKGSNNAPSESSVEHATLSIRNTLLKTILDQTIGSIVNTYLFCVFVAAFKIALAEPIELDELAREDASLPSLGLPLDFGRDYWSLVLSGAKADFLPLLIDGWKLWPAVSLISFAFLKSVQARNLLLGVAGLCWGVYLSMYTSETST